MKSKSSLKSTIKAVAAVLCVVSACAYGANLPQVAFHVSPTGDDSADGSCERPFATVARARDAVRTLKKSGALPKGGVNVWLRGGEYPMRESLVLGREDSGAAGAPVAYRAWKGEQPVFTGAWTVPPSAWRLADDPRIPAEAKGKVWVADVKSLGYDAFEPDALCGFHTAHICFEGIAFRGGRHHGVEMRGVSDVKIERCEFRNFGGHGLVLDHARDSLVRGCSFHTFGHCAMTLDGGDRKTLTSSGVTFSPWTQDHWRKFLSGARGKTSREAANVEGAIGR